MIRLATLFWLVLVSASGFAMFAVKYGVQSIEEDLSRTRKATAAERYEMHVLEAEWAYLTRPEILDEINRRHLQLAPISVKQLRAGVEDIPLRPAPPAPVEMASAGISAAGGAQMPTGPAEESGVPPPAPLAEPKAPPAEPVTAALSPAPAESAGSSAVVQARESTPSAEASSPAAQAASVPKPPAARPPPAVKSTPVKAVISKPAETPKSLDELFARIATGR